MATGNGGTKVGSAYVQLLPTMQGFSDKVNNYLGGIDTSTSSQLLGKGIGSGIGSGLSTAKIAIGNALGSLISTVAGTVSSSLGSAISRVDTLANFPRVMTSLGYSSEVASGSIKKISEALDGLPTTTDAMVSDVQMLAASLGDLSKATDIGLAFNNMMLAGGASAYSASMAFRQFNQIIAKGQVDTQSWYSIVQTAPGQVDQLAKSLLGATATQSDLREALNDGTVSMEEFEQAIISLNENGGDGFESFERQARSATGGIGTAIENVGNRVSKAMATIVDAIGQKEISGAINDFSSNFKYFGQVGAEFITRLKEDFSNSGLAEKIEEISSAFSWLAPNIDAIKQAARDAADFVSTLVSAFFQNVDWDTLSEKLKNVADRIDEAFSSEHTTNAEDIGKALGDLANVLMTIVDAVAFTVEGIAGIYEWLKNIDNAIVEWNGGEAIELTNLESVGGAIVRIFQPVIDWLVKTHQTLFGWISGFVSSVVGIVTGAAGAIAGFVSGIATAIMGVINGVIEFVSGVPGAIAGFFAGLPAALNEFFGEMKTNAETAFNDLLTFIQEIPGKIVGFFSGLASDVANAIGTFSIPLPHFSVSPSGWQIGDLLKGVIPELAVSWYAKGGVFDGASLIGVGEQGPEAVLPLNAQTYAGIGAGIAESLKAGGGDTYNFYFNGNRINDDAGIRDATRDYLINLKRLAVI